jgi:hypothetical protein
MTIATNVTWASAIKHHPDFQKSTENLGSFASIINDPSLDAATCLATLATNRTPSSSSRPPSTNDHWPSTISTTHHHLIYGLSETGGRQTTSIGSAPLLIMTYLLVYLLVQVLVPLRASLFAGEPGSRPSARFPGNLDS